VKITLQAKPCVLEWIADGKTSPLAP